MSITVVTCLECDQEMTHWYDGDYYRCPTCGTKVGVKRTRGPVGAPSEHSPQPTPSVVYFLKTHGRVKIGRTQGLSGRIAALSLEPTACILALLGGPQLEHELHQRFAPYRIHPRREWFTWNDDIAGFIAERRSDDITRQALRSFLP